MLMTRASGIVLQENLAFKKTLKTANVQMLKCHGIYFFVQFHTDHITQFHILIRICSRSDRRTCSMIALLAL